MVGGLSSDWIHFNTSWFLYFRSDDDDGGGANGAAFVSITYRILPRIRFAGIVMSDSGAKRLVDCNGCSSRSDTGENVRGNKKSTSGGGGGEFLIGI